MRIPYTARQEDDDGAILWHASEQDCRAGDPGNLVSMQAMADALIEIAVRNGPRECFCSPEGQRLAGCPGDRDPLDPDAETSEIYAIAARALGVL